MMTVAQIADTLARTTYRPEWTFTVYEDEYEGVHIRIVAPVDNAYDGKPITLGINSPLPPFDTRAELLRWLGWRLRRCESHESREWLQYDGKPVSDPHASEDLDTVVDAGWRQLLGDPS